MDLYRLKDVEEALQAGVEDALESDAVCWVEWPEKAEVLLPPDTVKVFIEPISEKERSIKVVIPR
jgi:tRNA threonylcarbamoyladenosine biosynthesis protein TsaE